MDLAFDVDVPVKKENRDDKFTAVGILKKLASALSGTNAGAAKFRGAVEDGTVSHELNMVSWITKLIMTYILSRYTMFLLHCSPLAQ